MQSQNSKVNNMGRAGCVGLLALCLALISPVSNSSAFAEDVEDYEVDTQALSSSIVNISFSPASGSTSLTPITSVGQSAQINVKATVNVQNSGGYSVYLKSNSPNLVGVNNPSNVIPGVAGSVTFNNLATNTWGYYAGEGDAVPENATYKAITTGQGDKIAENVGSKLVSDTKDIMLSFAAKIGDNMPADTYQNTVTMSVVSSPVQLALGDISDMQQMTSEICENTGPSATKQLRDVRDGKYYWVSKLADGRCWMTQNLDLDLNASTLPLKPATSDVSAEWTPMDGSEVLYTADVVDKDTILVSDIGQRSWSLGDVRIINPTISSGCGSMGKATTCDSRFATYATPTSANGESDAHYILGNHYQWNAATAGSGGDITEGQAGSSICPRGWKLPTSNSGETTVLANALGLQDGSIKITAEPFYGVRGGAIDQSVENLWNRGGERGLYWSSTPNVNGLWAYNLYFLGAATNTNTINPSNVTIGRGAGINVRCMAK